MVTFTTGDIPPTIDADTTGSSVGSNDPVCEVCEAPLYYGGRGRRPKFCDEHKPTATRTGTTRRSAKDVESAMAALDAMHTSLSFGLLLFAGNAASAWEAQRPALDERNRKILEMDPALAKRLATVAAKGGAPALVLSHLIAVAPAAGLAFAKVKEARRSAAENRPAPEPDYGFQEQRFDAPSDGGYVDPVDANMAHR